MYRGTTPTYTFTLPDEVDLTLADKVYVTFAEMDETIIYTKENDDLEISEHSVSVYLTQEETLALPNGRVKVQLNWLYEEENHTKRACSNKLVINTQKNLINYVLDGSEDEGGDEGGGESSDFSTAHLTIIANRQVELTVPFVDETGDWGYQPCVYAEIFNLDPYNLNITELLVPLYKGVCAFPSSIIPTISGNATITDNVIIIQGDCTLTYN